MPDKKGCCELCGRDEMLLTRHHLIPRTRHGNRRIRRQYQREELLTAIIWVCRPCHNQIHAVLSEKQLADHYHSLTLLQAHEEIQRFVEWIKDKPAGFKPRSYSMRHRH